eukprot:TRINITY_DN112583_c0_g1_i1.p1 TRINITY_DN112583_c0_g1~~TRINITY_DN112583_c0_g1_i1.p1  ORF type:complete len:532 (+),score=142.92 TRINITY_DN112583_c0_g1_i1:154-1749(+)
MKAELGWLLQACFLHVATSIHSATVREFEVLASDTAFVNLTRRRELLDRLHRQRRDDNHVHPAAQTRQPANSSSLVSIGSRRSTATGKDVYVSTAPSQASAPEDYADPVQSALHFSAESIPESLGSAGAAAVMNLPPATMMPASGQRALDAGSNPAQVGGDRKIVAERLPGHDASLLNDFVGEIPAASSGPPAEQPQPEQAVAEQSEEAVARPGATIAPCPPEPCEKLDPCEEAVEVDTAAQEDLSALLSPAAPGSVAAAAAESLADPGAQQRAETAAAVIGAQATAYREQAKSLAQPAVAKVVTKVEGDPVPLEEEARVQDARARQAVQDAQKIKEEAKVAAEHSDAKFAEAAEAAAEAYLLKGEAAKGLQRESEALLKSSGEDDSDMQTVLKTLAADEPLTPAAKAEGVAEAAAAAAKEAAEMAKKNGQDPNVAAEAAAAAVENGMPPGEWSPGMTQSAGTPPFVVPGVQSAPNAALPGYGYSQPPDAPARGEGNFEVVKSAAAERATLLLRSVTRVGMAIGFCRLIVS